MSGKNERVESLQVMLDGPEDTRSASATPYSAKYSWWKTLFGAIRRVAKKVEATCRRPHRRISNCIT